MTPLEALMAERPAISLQLRPLPDGRPAAMIEIETADGLFVGWGGRAPVEVAMADALVQAVESWKARA